LKNPCGTCATLAGAPGTTCNACGTYVCSADNLSVTCTAGNPVKTRCNNHNAEACQSGGAWGTSDMCNLSTEICRSGACVTNSPYPVGFPTVDATWSAFAVSNGVAYFMPVAVPNTAVEISLEVQASATGGLGHMYLFTDSGGAPGTFIASTGDFAISAGDSGDSVVPVGSFSSQLTGGQTYWIGAEFFLSGGSASIYQKGSSSRLYALSRTFDSTMPSTFPVASATPLTGSVSFSIVVRDVP
jgi:hypothetical protein